MNGSIRLAADVRVELFSEANVIEPVVERFAWGVSTNDDPAAATMTVRIDPGVEQVRVRVGDPAKGIVWRTETHGILEVDRGLASVDLTDPSHSRIDLAVAPGHEFEATLRVLRAAAELLVDARGVAVLHAGAAVVDGRAWLFLGQSGAGKTTTARRVGREGALRIADDTVLFRFSDETVEPFVLDRGGWLPGRRGLRWPIGGALVVKKGAESTALRQLSGDPFRVWLEAVFSPGLPLGLRMRLVENVGRQAMLRRPVEFDVASRGPVLAALRNSAGSGVAA